MERFVERMNRHTDWYNGNTQVLSGFDFLTKMVRAWFPTAAADDALTG